MPPRAENNSSGPLDAGSFRTAAYNSCAIGTCASTSTFSTRCPPMLMPRMAAAADSASAALAATLMPPALPRLPVGTCALSTHGPSLSAICAASAGVAARAPCGVSIPAARNKGLAACSSKFIGPPAPLQSRLSASTRRPQWPLRGPPRGSHSFRAEAKRIGVHCALVFGIAAKLLVAERAVGPAKQVDATMAIVGLDALQHGPGFVDAPGHAPPLTCRTSPSRRRTARPRWACPRGWW